METIILTDNKRLSTDYCADKTLFAQKIDVNHILNTQVYQSHISRARFWIIRTNIYNQQNLVHELCKNLVNRGSTTISFQFSITKIALGQQTPYIQQKRINTPNDKYMRSSRVSGYLTPSAIKTLQFPQFINLKKQSSHTKTISSVQWSHQNQFLQEGEKKSQQKQNSSREKQEQIVTLKPLFKKEFDISSLNELSAVFMSKEGIFNEFGMSEQIVMKSKRMITTYLFRQNDIEIGLSVVSQGCRMYLQKAINIQISQAFNIQFNSCKQAYQNTCITQNFSTTTIPKSSTKLNHQIQKQTYHKVLLFLFSHYEHQSQKSKSSTSQSNGNKEISKFIQAIQEWKMKDQDINITQKLSKQYVLIKQQVQNEKANFKNKLKVFQAIIGESVNVDKLLNEQKQMQSSTNTNLGNNPTQSVSGNIADARPSRRSQIKQILNNSPQPMTSNNSQFKRLKQSFEMIRNIDNVINEQSKKIETLKKYSKQIIKSKNEILYKNARSLNQIKKQIKQIQQQIQQKKIQYRFKNQKLQNDRVQKKRNFIPTNQAQQLLNNNVRLFKRIINNEKTNKNNQKYLIEDDLPITINNKQSINITNKQNEQKYNLNTTNNNKDKYENDIKKHFMIRKQYKSFYNNSSNLSTDILCNRQYNVNLSIINSPSTILTTISNTQQDKQQKMMNKRKQQVQNYKLWFNINKQQNRKQSYQQKGQQLSNDKQKLVLITLYKYYIKNRSLIQQINYQINSYHNINNQQKMDLTLNNSNNKSQLLNNNSRITYNSLYTNQNRSQLNSTSQLNQFKLSNNPMNNNNKANNNNLFLNNNFKLVNTNSTILNNNSKILNNIQLIFDNFPLLNQILNPKISQSAFQSQQCSVISDTISQTKLQTNDQSISNQNKNKRVTLDNNLQKK